MICINQLIEVSVSPYEIKHHMVSRFRIMLLLNLMCLMKFPTFKLQNSILFQCTARSTHLFTHEGSLFYGHPVPRRQFSSSPCRFPSNPPSALFCVFFFPLLFLQLLPDQVGGLLRQKVSCVRCALTPTQ